MTTPQVPPRPQRNSNNNAGPTEVKNDLPSIPPRPVRLNDPSPNREAYTRSPLNGPPVALANRRASQDNGRTSSELPRRPPSVSLPSVGQEGSEYSSYDQLPPDAHGVSLEAAAEQQKSVSPDLPMHQPVASIATSTAKRQIQPVTRTNSTQAAAAGIGKPPSINDPLQAPSAEPSGSSHVTSRTNDVHPLRAKASWNRSTSSLHEHSNSRPGSVHGGVDHEHGIPMLGQQVPLLAYAGDVQAPSPAPGQTAFPPGIGFFNDGSTRHHNRKRSSRQEFQPADVYGIRHDHESKDQFEKDWAAKHPVEAFKEEHAMDLPRPQSAMSSEQLNRLVHQHQDIGMGTSPNVIGTPDEQIAFNASQEYVGRTSTNTQASQAPLADRRKRPSSGSQPAVESPLRKNFGRQNDHVLDSEDEQSYHLKPPIRKMNKVTGGGDADNRLNLGPSGEDGGYISEHADSTPILASDEIVKRPGSAWMHAAVEPSMDRNPDEYYDSDHGQWPNSRRNSVNPPSRPSSRPSSVHGNVGGYHGGPLHRYVSHEEHHSGVGTPLEEIEEYEPLFPEDEKEGQSPRKAFKKRPDLASHHFPSQDVWEDNPSSLEYSATVSTPDLERNLPPAETGSGAAASFETPAQEQARRDRNPEDMTSSNKTFAKPHFKAGVQEDVHRPGAQRFPSSDVWEDSPDSFNLTTTVSGPQLDESRNLPEDAPVPGRPSVPARPERSSKLAQETKPGMVPSQGDAKPSVPARPVRSSQTDASADPSAPAVAKSKPAVPARPVGSKIGALQSSFMNDLNNRLKLGPQGPPPKKEEPEISEEAAREPLADARKSRAKGPARRKPAVTEAKKSSFAFSPLITVWTIDEEDEVQVTPQQNTKPTAAAKERAPSVEEAEIILAENESQNTKAPVFSAPPGTGEDMALPEGAIGTEGDKPDQILTPAVVAEQKAIQPEFEQALKESEADVVAVDQV